MPDTFDPQEALRLQRLLISKELTSGTVAASHDQQQTYAAGSAQREHQGRVTNEALDRLGKMADELREAGVIDGMGALTPKARASGIRSARLSNGELRTSYEFDPRLPT